MKRYSIGPYKAIILPCLFTCGFCHVVFDTEASQQMPHNQVLVQRSGDVTPQCNTAVDNGEQHRVCACKEMDNMVYPDAHKLMDGEIAKVTMAGYFATGTCTIMCLTMAIGNRQYAICNRQQAICHRQQALGTRQQAIGNIPSDKDGRSRQGFLLVLYSNSLVTQDCWLSGA